MNCRESFRHPTVVPPSPPRIHQLGRTLPRQPRDCRHKHRSGSARASGAKRGGALPASAGRAGLPSGQGVVAALGRGRIQAARNVTTRERADAQDAAVLTGVASKRSSTIDRPGGARNEIAP